MADSDPHESGGGVRRRRSSHNDVDHTVQNTESGQEQHMAGAAHHAAPTNATDGHARSLSASSAIAIDNLPAVQPTSPLDSNPRTVRFSADLDSDTRPSDVRPASSLVSPANSTSRNARSRGLGLAIDIPQEGGAERESTVLGQARGGVLSPKDRSSAKSSASPLSPRSRGYSLRTNLFRKNMDGQQLGSAIELEEAGSSTGGPGAFDVSREDSKKSTPPTVTIAPLPELESPPRSKSGHKGNNAFAALPNYQSWVQSRTRKAGIMRRIKEATRSLKKTILRIQELPPTKDGRHIILDATRKKSLIDERTGKGYVENWIRSTRFTAYTFLPRQLVAQFSRLANFYFLCVSILQTIKGLSTTGQYTTIAPLLFFVSISIGKEGYDDFRRYRLDKEENARETSVLHAYKSIPDSDGQGAGDWSPSVGPLHWAVIQWRKLRVGDIVKLKRNEAAPADLILLHADGPNNIAYFETMALDGETNLKSKQTTTSLTKSCMTEESLAACRAEFVVEDPNPNLYSFEGRVTVDGETSPLTNTEIIYRGSILRNTPEAIGMVIYTGEECKIRMNANKNPRIKAPHLQFVLNRIVMIVVAFVLSLAIFNTVAYQFWRRTVERKSWYINDAPVPFHQSMFAFFIMFSTMIPLSLYVSMEIIKLAQMFLLSDVDMYDEKSNTPFEARTSTINEELGQVTHIFSDKTGTLTDNEMKFRKLSVAGTVWLHDFDLKPDDNKNKLIHKKRSKGKKPARKSSTLERRKPSTELANLGAQIDGASATASADEPKWKSSARPARSQPELRTVELIRYLQRHPRSSFAQKARILLLSIALCHTCLPETREDGQIDFQASSPDELALVRAAQELGYVIIDRDHGTVTLKLQPYLDTTVEPITETYEILDTIDFSSTRKRMSVVVRFPDGRVCVMCKGADSIVMKRLKMAALAQRKITEIEKRANRRKNMEAHVAMARRSTQIDRSNSIRRASLSIGPPRRSTSTAHPARADVDNWLKSRERDVELVDMEDEEFYTPRASVQLNRLSMAGSEARNSIISEDNDELVDESLAADEPAIIERCFQHINDFATDGLRTLLYGYRFMDESEYGEWKQVYLAATTSLVEREGKIEKAGEMIEYDFELAGATAIEDKLQSGVPESIDKLRRANIHMWMLTGDKRETAINIGHSCRLIKDYSTVLVLDREIGEVEQHIAAGIVTINSSKVAHCVVVVDGQTMAMITENKQLERLFFDLTILADSVICCRAQPSQKAQLVRAIRKRVKNSITLAIGDGANDIAMIQEAHVGIGITGKEGLQAARTSDYSIAQFRFLNKLLLVHGRWNYIRTCKYILGTLWKEVLFFLTQALYQRYNGYTGTSLYESWSLATFNTLFTSLPVLVMGIFEKDLAASTLLAVPELYTIGQRDGAFNIWVYLGWMFMAAAESMIIFFCMLGLFGQAIFTTDDSLFAMGDLTFVACIFIITMKMQLVEMHNKSVIALGAIILSLGAVFLWNIILASIYPNDKVYHVRHAYFVGFGRNPLWWLSLILVVLCVAVFEFGAASVRSAYFPTDLDVFQELEQDIEIRKRFEEASAMELRQGWDRGENKGGKAEPRGSWGDERDVEGGLRHRGGDGANGNEEVTRSGVRPR